MVLAPVGPLTESVGSGVRTMLYQEGSKRVLFVISVVMPPYQLSATDHGRNEMN